MFVREDEASGLADPRGLFMRDALSRLTDVERERFKSLGQVRGFLFSGEKYTCIVVVSLRTEVMQHASDPVFCYDKITNTFAERL